ncbi:DUF4179 domain-containing protein [Sporosarcina sp. BI001-red]|uniref:DUF4179 domain-containing protein n=1 Tax=Sporosarcina sp. BI001-red TaxID=2282866 RepID=UPI000E224EA5|nr:DUF4179 domain-containing protein [Sporosarcina sp. BI001-red]REB05250.1 DUF4179 domain-containing protein [Sporosarcina sp. BI001-red]
MYEREEERLSELKSHLEQQTLPLDEADQMILAGITKAKADRSKQKRRRKRVTWMVAMAAILLLTFVTSIRVSTAFANTIAAIPGMEPFVALIQHDKGLQAIFNEDYYQEIGSSQTVGDVTMTIDGVILDETGMNVYYTIESSKKMKTASVNTIEITNSRPMPEAGISYGGMSANDVFSYQEIMELTFPKRNVFSDLNFTIEAEMDIDEKMVAFLIPFEVPEQTKPSKPYVLNEITELDGQHFTIDEVVDSPLRVAVQVTFDPNNTKKILSFEDMRLVDERGEVWSKIANGVTAFGNEKGKTTHTFFLQSNYFSTPKKLYLQINKAQAIKREQAFVEVNTDTKELLTFPDGPQLQLVDADRNGIELSLSVKDFNHDPFTAAMDAQGKEISISSFSLYGEGDATHWSPAFETTSYTNPIRLELNAYPTYIEGDVKVEVK